MLGIIGAANLRGYAQLDLGTTQRTMPCLQSFAAAIGMHVSLVRKLLYTDHMRCSPIRDQIIQTLSRSGPIFFVHLPISGSADPMQSIWSVFFYHLALCVRQSALRDIVYRTIDRDPLDLSQRAAFDRSAWVVFLTIEILSASVIGYPPLRLLPSMPTGLSVLEALQAHESDRAFRLMQQKCHHLRSRFEPPD
jgi:hypothetical protein